MSLMFLGIEVYPPLAEYPLEFDEIDGCFTLALQLVAETLVAVVEMLRILELS